MIGQHKLCICYAATSKQAPTIFGCAPLASQPPFPHLKGKKKRTQTQTKQTMVRAMRLYCSYQAGDHHVHSKRPKIDRGNSTSNRPTTLPPNSGRSKVSLSLCFSLSSLDNICLGIFWGGCAKEKPEGSPYCDALPCSFLASITYHLQPGISVEAPRTPH